MNLNVKAYPGSSGRFWWKAMDEDGKSEFRSATRYDTKEEADAHLTASREAWAEQSGVVERTRQEWRAEVESLMSMHDAQIGQLNKERYQLDNDLREALRRQSEIRAVKDEELAERDKVIDGLRAELDWTEKSRDAWMEESNKRDDRIDHLESRWANRFKPWTWF